MSMISVQIDELRDAARGQKAMGLFELAQMLNDAADTIWELRDDLQRTHRDNDKPREEIEACEHDMRSGTCEADETDTWECVRDDLGGYGKRLTVHVMECTECGHTYEHVNGDYEFCPRCGRKRKDVDE